MVLGAGLSVHRLNAQERNTAPHRTFGIACEKCHTPSGWNSIKNYIAFDHEKTGFHLRGQHANVACNVCHRGQGIEAFGEGCVSCHEDKHRTEFGVDCEYCHTPEGWRFPGMFIELHEATRFPLLGAHRMIDCQNCHVNQENDEFTPMPFRCQDCHLNNYMQAKSVDHVRARLSLQCEECHDIERVSWAPARFDHATFPLEGAHASIPCADCHKTGFDPSATNCIDCHRDVYQGARNPDHAAANYPENCSICHSSVSWSPAQFNHDRARFPLVGRHVGVDCAACHVDNRYTGTPSDCNSCHHQDYDDAKNPNHALSDFPRDCAACHTASGWSPASFDHDATTFALTGAHRSAACTRCHVNNQWSGLPSACIDCHRDKYDAATNPDHRSANFPADCSVCHGTSSWTPSTFDHDGRYFPIYSGEHRGKWSQCIECHTNTADYKSFSCIDCHEHNKTDTDKEHRDEAGYRYNSADCYRCHPQGK